MKKFMILYMGTTTAEEQMKAGSPEEAKKGMDMWTAWYDKTGKAIVDAGAPLKESVHVGKNEHPKATAHITGYTVVEAKDMDEVKKLLETHPHLMMPNTCIEVLEFLPMPGM
jgi:hypothetical protein